MSELHCSCSRAYSAKLKRMAIKYPNRMCPVDDHARRDNAEVLSEFLCSQIQVPAHRLLEAKR